MVLTHIQLYPYIATILLILFTMPASTETAEQSFSAMNRIKTFVSSTRTNDRLSATATLHRD